MKIVYIASLAHSGSTVLDMALGCHPSIVGLGEINSMIVAKKKEAPLRSLSNPICSCGQTISSCEFWGDLTSRIEEKKSQPFISKYDLLAKYFQQKYGSDKILLDSSKDLNSNVLYLNQHYDLNVIFLVRDFRGWIKSRNSRHGTALLKLAYQWFKNNYKMKNFLRNNKLRYITVGYEEFAFYPEFVINKICNFIGLQKRTGNLDLKYSKSHIMQGNIMRLDSDKKKSIYYDARWLSDIKISLLMPFMIPVQAWNAQNVYKNIRGENTSAFGIKQRDYYLFGDKRKETIIKKMNKYK